VSNKKARLNGLKRMVRLEALRDEVDGALSQGVLLAVIRNKNSTVLTKSLSSRRRKTIIKVR
jgi:hypothetical protein